MRMDSESLQECAQEFKTARGEFDGAVKRMDEAVMALQKKWEGASKQEFYRQYQLLHEYMERFGKLVSSIAVELDATAEKLEEADK